MDEKDPIKVEVAEEISVDEILRRARTATHTMSDGNPNKRLMAQLATGLNEVALRLQLERQMFSSLIVAVEALIAAAPGTSLSAAGIKAVEAEYKKLVHDGAVVPEQPDGKLVVM